MAQLLGGRAPGEDDWLGHGRSTGATSWPACDREKTGEADSTTS